MKARGADLIIITDKPELAKDLDATAIVIPQNGPMTALGAVVPLQLIAYELALLRYDSLAMKIVKYEHSHTNGIYADSLQRSQSRRTSQSCEVLSLKNELV